MPDDARSSFPTVSTVGGLLCFALALLPNVDLLAFERTLIFQGEVWRLWTGHLVHFSLQHALIDAAVVMVLGAVVERECGTRALAWFWLAGLPVMSLGLLFLAPEMAYYRGASGIGVAMAFLAGTGLWFAVPRWRLWLTLLGLGLLLKIALDALGLLPASAHLPEGVAVAWQMHLLGAMAGSALGLVAQNGRAVHVIERAARARPDA